jgi:chorismate-pyruvate lyase
LPETSEKIELGRKFGGDPPNSANRSWCQKVGQMSRVFQVQTTGRFEVEDFANRSWCQKVEQTPRVFQVQATGRFEVEDFAI